MIAVALALCLSAVAAGAEDVLVIRDGSRRSGTVSGCRDDGCTLDGQRVARGLIAWVGLSRAADARTPAPRDPLVDQYAKVLRLMPQVQQQVNWFRTQDQKYWDQWQKYDRDCAEYARCKGLPAPPCPAPPATPSGPMPPH